MEPKSRKAQFISRIVHKKMEDIKMQRFCPSYGTGRQNIGLSPSVSRERSGANLRAAMTEGKWCLANNTIILS